MDLTRNTRCQHFRKEEWNLKRGFQHNMRFKEYVKFFVDCTDNERTYRVQIKGVAATERREEEHRARRTYFCTRIARVFRAAPAWSVLPLAARHNTADLGRHSYPSVVRTLSAEIWCFL